MDYDEYNAYERKKYIKELTQLWLHTCSFRELGGSYLKRYLHYNETAMVCDVWRGKNLINTLIESLSIVPAMMKIISKTIRLMQCVPCEQSSSSSLLPNEQI